MLIYPSTRIEATQERPVAAGQTITAEGAILVSAYTAGAFGVKMCSASATEKFVGVSISRVIPTSQVPKMETLVAAAGKVTLAADAVIGSVRVIQTVLGTAYTVSTGAPAGAGDAQITAGAPRTVNFFGAGQDGKTILVTYLTNLTVAQGVMLQGNADAGGPAGAYLGQIGVITKGDVFTDQFDTLVDWSSPTDLRLGANGKFTIGGAGALINGYVISSPADGSPFLGVHINAD